MERIRVLASEKFYDKMVFSFVEISNDNDEEWIAKVLVLFRARKRNFGLIQWLDDDYTSTRKTKVHEDSTGMRRLRLCNHFQVHSTELYLLLTSCGLTPVVFSSSLADCSCFQHFARGSCLIFRQGELLPR